ncbi:hypothetical protein OZD66_01950, partial [Wolbachia endosymbiont of Drosophila baimaii]|uniref:hypothetical protein n=1 Tax=Wolbachia endosymbiont of Drosophila baimaii TaxID=375917 RepID=UPI0023A9A946
MWKLICLLIHKIPLKLELTLSKTIKTASKIKKKVLEAWQSIAFLIIVQTGHRKEESTARRKDSNRGMFF